MPVHLTDWVGSGDVPLRMVPHSLCLLRQTGWLTINFSQFWRLGISRLRCWQIEGLFSVCRKRGRYWAVGTVEMRLRHVLRRHLQLQLPDFSSQEAGSRLLLGQEKQAFIALETG